LESARKVFYEFGFDGATGDMIAAAASVSKRTLYARFENKARIFEAVILDEIETQVRALVPTVDETLPIRRKLEAVAEAFLNWLLTDRVAAMERVVIAQAVRFPALAATIHDCGYQRAVQWVASILAFATAKGEIEIDDPVFAAEQFVTVVVIAPMRRAALGLIPARYDDFARERMSRSIRLFLDGCRSTVRDSPR